MFECIGYGAVRLTLDAEEPGDGDEEEADDAPDPEEVASDVVEADGGDHDDDELCLCELGCHVLCDWLVRLTFESQWEKTPTAIALFLTRRG